MNQDQCREAFRRIGIIPVVVLEDAKDAVRLGQALTEGGLPAAEVTFRTPAAEESIRRMSQSCPGLLVGAGTVLDTEQAERAVEAGAAFIVSPGLNPELVTWCQERGIPVFPGVQTPTEMEAAMRLGLSTVKFFPAEPAGGLPMIRAVSAPYTTLSFMPTGGISPANVRDYLKTGCIVACGGSWMVKTSMIAAGEWDRIEALVREAAAIVAECRLAAGADGQEG
ncbi:MAG: bifunctional 4-hydroxy-2-oxoglutarate aldolase/2-dehydro-3-deoxy-phosphogluconate aldolase [Lachnospiraceae bacterium]|nr:bifunctional 4-hydroxy-2-oxoglutarate aldolase/2-dehydro-3-deoxy-phosphogluconate aldolase [Lachnospiraceae bacterium]